MISYSSVLALAKGSAEIQKKDADEVEKERQSLIAYVQKQNPGADLKQGVPLNFHWSILKNLRR
jgi:hypothetical protein